METKHFGNLEVRLFNNFEELSKQAAEIFAVECKKTLGSKDTFTVSLCGGSTPQRLFELLASDFKNKIYWQKVHIFFGDEREKKENPESNFQIAYRNWLGKIVKEIPAFQNNIHRIKIELGLVDGVKEYEKEINKFAPQGFDLSFNGAGSDGHRNGIFPEQVFISEFSKFRNKEKPKVNWKNRIWDLSERVKVYGYKVPPEINPHTERITLTPWFLNKSKVNILMLSGLEKSDVLRKITVEKENYNKRVLPAITFNEVPIIVLVDKAAASKI